jgi:ribosomal protein S18 acetylase RimI-like enzyme
MKLEFRTLSLYIVNSTLASVENDNENIVVGYITCNIKEGPDETFGDLTLMACDPNYKDLSVSWRLLYAGVEWFQSKGIERVEGCTHEQNKACRAMYEVAGMKILYKSHDYHFWTQNK